MTNELSQFMAIFEGLDIAYGTYRIEGSKSNGKQAGKAVVVRQPPTKDLWERHLRGGEPSLGIIPIRGDNSCGWGCIDIDQYPLDLGLVVHKVRSLGLPLVVCRSKSGGAHVFCFVSSPIPAGDMQEYLRACSALIGESGREIFPKQAEILIERGDTGNFLNLPYHNADETLRYAIKDNGEAATLEEFFELYRQHVQTPPLTIPQAPKAAEKVIADGPPCLQALCSQGFPEGTRNNGLFSLGVYLKKAFPEAWENKLMEHNMNYFSPPLGISELQIVVKQLNKKTYNYKCKDQPLVSFCNSGLCRTRKYGIGSEGPDSPRLTSLSKYASEPPLWFLDVNGKRIELETESLFNQASFQKACMEKINVVPPTLRKNDWEGVLNGLLREMVELEHIQDASEDTTTTGRFNDLLEEFCTHLHQAMDRDEILMGRPWTDEEQAAVYFRMKDLEAHLKRNNMLLSSPKVAQRLRDLGGQSQVLWLKARATRVWKIDAFTKQDSPFPTPEQSSGAPF
jgi:hypothetical protein